MVLHPPRASSAPSFHHIPFIALIVQESFLCEAALFCVPDETSYRQAFVATTSAFEATQCPRAFTFTPVIWAFITVYHIQHIVSTYPHP
jgi:hypothetical protein